MANRAYVGGMRSLLIGMVMVMCACGSGPGEPLTADEFCDRWAVSYCPRVEACSGWDADDCAESVLMACCDNHGCDTVERTNIPDSRMAECESAIAVAPCEDELPVIPDACMLGD